MLSANQYPDTNSNSPLRSLPRDLIRGLLFKMLDTKKEASQELVPEAEEELALAAELDELDGE